MLLSNRSNKVSRSDLKNITLIEINKTQELNKNLQKLSMLISFSKTLKEKEFMT
jgi:hypothetical protein